MRYLLAMPLAVLALGCSTTARAEDPFAEGADALAVADNDGSTSLRAKLALKKMAPTMILVKVAGINDTDFPNCVLSATVLKAATSKEKRFKLLGQGKTYRFVPVLKLKAGQVDLKEALNQNNLGACFYPKKTTLVVDVSGVDLKKKAFTAAAIYLK